MQSIPPPPRPPDDETDARWRSQATMLILLSESYGDDPNDVVNGWMQQHLGAAADMVGPPDVSANTLLTAAVQLSTPGLYGLGAPMIEHLIPDGGGLLSWASEAGLWTKMQYVQKCVFGIGDWVLAFSLGTKGDLVVRNAYPHRIWTRTDTVDASELLELRELRYCRVAPGSPSYAWYWFCYKIDGTPCHYVLDAEGNYCSNLHLLVGGEYAPPEGLEGDAYPYRYADGTPFIPYQFYSDIDSGSLWNLTGRRGARVGALNSIVLSTYGLRAALSAAVPPIMAINLQKPAGNQRGLMMGTQGGDPSSSDSIPVTPGSILFLQESADAKSSPSVSQLQGGNNLQALSQYTDGYTQGQLARLGLAGDQVQRNTSNPTSAGALSITQSAKRMVAAMVAPFFRKCDLQALKKIAALARLAGVGDWPESGWSISYQQIPLSPDEEKAQREQEDHDKSLGLISTVDLWLRRHPGQSRAEAVLHLRRIREEETLLSAPVPKMIEAIKKDEVSEELPKEDSTSEEVSAELPKEDDASEEAEAQAIDDVAEELDALDELLPIDADGADIDIPAIKASLANIRAALDLK